MDSGADGLGRGARPAPESADPADAPPDVLVESQLLDSFYRVLTGRWGASRWRWARSLSGGGELLWVRYPDSCAPDPAEWAPARSTGTDVDGWWYAPASDLIGVARTGSVRAARPTDKAVSYTHLTLPTKRIV